LRCTGRGESLCALAILSPEVLVFENTLEVPEVAGSAPVKEGVRFYAGAPLTTPDGYHIGTICVADFHVRRFSMHEQQVLQALARVVMEQMELRLAAMTDSEKQTLLLDQKDEFLSVASHELKTPLTTLTGSLQLLNKIKHDHKPDVFDKMLGQANRSLEKINRLVADLLHVKRITTGNLPLKRTTFRIGKVIDECCGHIREEGNYHILLNGEKDLEVFADEQKIDQVMVNLVNNAVKYAPLSKDIHVNVARAGEFAKISVRDEGPGIAPQNLPRIFDRYYRSGDYNISGLGLGLYIISEIIKHHGGEVGVTSELGKGTTFWFTLPLAKNSIH
jgi:signal transduction histidine kinase